MRYPAAEKLEIIRLVEQSHLPVRRVLEQIGIPRSTFYRWCDLYQTGGPEALDDRSPRPDRVWNRIPDDVRARIVTLALDEPELSPRELAVRFTDAERYFVSEASVYRLLKARDLITSPAFIVMKAADEFKNKTTAPDQLWQTDFTYLKVTGWGWFYLSTVLDDFSRYIVAWKLCTTMKAEDVTDTLELALQASGLDQVNVAHRPRLLSDNGPSLRLGGVGGMARQTRHAAYPRRALSSDDTGEDRALASDAQEPHPAGELLFARRARGSDRSLRRPLQSPALPREHRQSDAGTRLLRTRSNHPAGKRKDQTQNHPTPTLASQNSRSLKSNRMRQNLP
jgi:putative transposase